MSHLHSSAKSPAPATLLPVAHLNWVAPFRSVLDEVGAPCDRLMRDSKLPTQAYGEPWAMAPASHIYGFMRRCAESEGMPDLGFRAAKRVPATMLGLHRQPERPRLLASILQSYFDTMRRCSPHARVWLTPTTQGQIELGFLCSTPCSPGSLWGEQFAIGVHVALIRAAAGKDWTPDYIRVQKTRRQVLAESGLVDPNHIYTDQRVTAIGMSRDILALEVLELVLDGYDQEEDAPTPDPPPAPDTFGEALGQSLRPFLVEGNAKIQLAAELSGMSVRTLQRALETEDLTYSKLLTGVRREIAHDLLLNPDIPIRAIAQELGYAEPAVFTRAFYRWTGVTPTRFRALHCADRKDRSDSNDKSDSDRGGPVPS